MAGLVPAMRKLRFPEIGVPGTGAKHDAEDLW